MKRPLYDLTYPGWAMVGATFLLCLIGVLCIVAARGPDVPPDAGIRQLAFLLGSVVVGCVLLRIGYQRLGRWAYALFGIGVLLLLLLVVARQLGSLPLIRPIKGTYRWISLPYFNLQPSEVVKVTFVLALAWYLRHKENVQRLRGLVGPFALSVLPMFLVLLQPDLGTSLLFMPVLFVMLFAAGARLRHFLIIVFLAVLCMPLFWTKMKPYQKDRIAGLLLQYDGVKQRVINDPDSWRWLCPEGAGAAQRWEHEDGYQLIGSLGALGNGGLLGQGWRQGAHVRYDFLPAKQNDFIFAIIGEQWGFIGCVLVLCCFVVIILAGLEIATRTADPFGRLVAVGCVSLLAAQAMINVGMTMGLTPITGMNLPFVSSGGSSLMVNFMLIALMINVSQHRPYLLARKPFEYGEAQYAGVR